jgi:hypothetical protein
VPQVREGLGAARPRRPLSRVRAKLPAVIEMRDDGRGSYRERIFADVKLPREVVHVAAEGRCARCGTDLGHAYPPGSLVVIAHADASRGSWRVWRPFGRPACEAAP